MNNPMRYIDLTGQSTWVMQNDDGTCRIVGGDLEDSDNNIYIYRIKHGNLTRGEPIGITTSLTSFYDSDMNDGKGGWVTGSNIHPNDKSGENFLYNVIILADIPVQYYMNNARTNQKFDFKATNGTNNVLYKTREPYYRGMPLRKNRNGIMMYSSAKDIGNIAAGYVAGIHGVSWERARKALISYSLFRKKSLLIKGLYL